MVLQRSWEESSLYATRVILRWLGPAEDDDIETSEPHLCFALHGLGCGALRLVHRMEGGFEHVERLLHLVVRDNQGHEQPDHVAVRAGRNRDHTVLVTVLCNLLSILRSGLSCLARLDQFECLHGAQAANVADLVPAALPSVGTFLKLVAQL